jgi:hypothetical protein
MKIWDVCVGVHNGRETLGFIEEKTLTLVWGDWHLEGSRIRVLGLGRIDWSCKDLVLGERNVLLDRFIFFWRFIYFEFLLSKWLGGGRLETLFLSRLTEVGVLVLFVKRELLVDELLLLIRILSLLHKLTRVV